MGIREKIENAQESDWFIENVSEDARKRNQDLVFISSVIMKKRKEMGYNQKEFAEMMGVTQGMVSKWESGTYNFTINTLNDICSKLELSFRPQFSDNHYYLQFYNKLQSKKKKINIKLKK